MNEETELTMLRNFFQTWCDFHALKRDKLHERQQKELINKMLEQAQTLIRFKNPVGTLTINGVKRG